MSKAIVLGALCGSVLVLSTPANAQGRSATSSGAAATQPPTLAERQSAWNANKAEYRRRVASDGQRSADRWLDQQVLAMRGGETADTSKPSSAASTSGKGKKDCKKVRWVNRATPGFGGSGMTMSRVAVCAD